MKTKFYVLLDCVAWKKGLLMVRFLRVHSLALILVLGLLNGLLYIFLVPPWQHYDEPGNFEYAWLVANRSSLPKPGDYDQAMHRAVADSMIKHKFFRGMDFFPDLNVTTGPIWIGGSQVDNKPFYYLLASVPLRLLSSWDITWQLYAARFVSLGLYLLSIVAAWGIMRELAPVGHPLCWMVPVCMALLPGYTDLMTAVNSDVGATMLFSLFLWGGVRMIREGFSFLRLLWVVSAALLCYWTKNNVFLSLPLLGLILLFSLFQGRRRWFPWVLSITAIPLILVSVFSWGDALLWIRSPNTVQRSPTRGLSAQAPLGRHVLQMEIAPNASPAIFQLLPTDQGNRLKGKTVTLGGWVWATQPLTINAFTLYDRHSHFSHAFQIGTSPTFFALSATLAADASRPLVILSPTGQRSQSTETIFYDGLILAEGARPLDTSPQFDDSTAQQGIWGGQPFNNLLRNASGETAGPSFRLWTEKYQPYIKNYFSPELALDSLFDWSGAGWYYKYTAQRLNRTFWAQFGWAQVPLILPFIPRPYFLLALISLAGLGGAGMALQQRRLTLLTLPWDVFLFLGVALAGVWGQTFLRGMDSLTYSWGIPVARYAYPAIIPTLLVLNVGWLEILRLLGKWLRMAPKIQFAVYLLFFVALDVFSLISIAHFYYYGGWVVNR
jgi:hypothetical protein